MSDAPSLAVQSVIYLNRPEDVIRAAESLANSVGLARAAGEIGDWTLQLGDCSPSHMLSDEQLDIVRSEVEAGGGALGYTFFDANLGSAAGHNALAALTSTELMVILNPDAIASPETITALAKAMVNGVGIAESRQIPIEHPKTYEKSTGDTSWASTACAMTRRDAFDRLGGFDADSFFLYCDDVDYSWRLRLAGYRVVYEPAARLFHDKRLTTTADWPASGAEIYYSAEAALFLAHKYSRHDLLHHLIRQFRKEKSEPVLRAVAEFERRSREHRLADPIDGDHKVAEFVNGNYAVHRF